MAFAPSEVIARTPKVDQRSISREERRLTGHSIMHLLAWGDGSQEMPERADHVIGSGTGRCGKCPASIPRHYRGGILLVSFQAVRDGCHSRHGDYALAPVQRKPGALVYIPFTDSLSTWSMKALLLTLGFLALFAADIVYNGGQEVAALLFLLN